MPLTAGDFWTSTSFAIPNSGSLIVPIDQTRVNVWGLLLSGGRVTVPRSGLYQICYKGSATNTLTTPAWSQWVLYVNGVAQLGSNIIANHAAGVSGYAGCFGQLLRSLNANDIIDMRVVGQAGSALNGWVCEFVIRQLSPIS